VLFTGYLTLSGAVAGSTDALAARLTRTAIGAAVPVVGNIINDAASSILAGAGALKNTIGVAGMLAVLATCLTPFLYLGVQYLLYKAAAFFAGTVGPEPLMRLISALGGAFGLILGMVGTCALLLLISVVSAVSLNVG
jgi:stage III sporulation protein AE